MTGFILIALATAPSVALLFYIYNRDRYDKEPRRSLFKAFLLGIVIVIPAVVLESILTAILGEGRGIIPAFYQGFLVAGLTEEGLKLFALYKGFFRSKEFNERFDGIVYSVFVSLGFATLENILYVTGGGVGVAFTRALTAVPAHALFGVAMGYYIGRARFASPSRVRVLLFKAFFVPLLLHGLYDFILFSENIVLLILFIPYMIYMWRRGMRNLKELDLAKEVQFNPNLQESELLEEEIFPDDLDEMDEFESENSNRG